MVYTSDHLRQAILYHVKNDRHRIEILAWICKLDINVIPDLFAQTKGDQIQKDRKLQLDKRLYRQL